MMAGPSTPMNAAHETDRLKQLARKQAEIVRSKTHRLNGQSASQIIADGGLCFVELEATSISGYIAHRSELDILPLMQKLCENGWQTCLPVVLRPASPLAFRQWRPGDEMQNGAFGIPVPKDTAETVTPHVLLVPLLSFDMMGYRLGYGGGFYDRTIASLGVKGPVVTVGMAYQDQQVKSVPRGKYDQPLDWIVTEKGPIKCG